ncbi:nucleotide modification associated domain-containing protein [Clostridium beijerinckii]|uniref:nucleotide modification associated domain-containing protein n=1 Tax=Clostridium beijerinckii TaxID=1520 RepID=UPI0012B186D8|nr:nucleotide modification associated domain-containing protein [Clostridium beijerinckii]KAB7198371.1 DUF1599 domain-containing protein [Bifidobacterium longum]MRY42696.1 DUF1599 domain-containing protein [Parabacteroides distasonis]MZK53625.1 DUF1599 domain-containing protein [Clostridium beijerinckii]MZK61736.1 DUF1599 domain-containing protein [Clostridium beijerinckii]MZK71935.1 DUF1599 domain-containing protein [Clostridium beijerinckii]
MKVKEISNEIAELLEKKNKDYGNSFDKTVEEYGATAYLLRIEDKISRLKSITKNKEILVTDESMEDTIKDIAGYSILMLNYLQAKQEARKPRINEVK